MKKETLEEVAEKLVLEYQLGNTGKIDIEDAKEMLIEFAKWQQERSYNEANEIIEFLDNEAKLKISDTKTIERIKWYFETYFEQFKKK